MIDKLNFIGELTSLIRVIEPSTDELKLNVRLQELLNNYKIESNRVEESENDIMDKVDLFLSAKKLEGLSPITLKGYRIELSSFSKSFEKSVEHISTLDIRNFLASNKDWKSETVSRKLSVLKSFFSWMVAEEVLLKNPTSKIKTPKKESRIPKSLTIEELELMRESCVTKRQRALLEALYSTGCRLSEIKNLNISDIDFQSMSCVVLGKGNKERVVYFSFKAMYHIKKYLNERKDNESALFVTERKPYRRVESRAIQREISKIGELSDINKSVSPHSLRHSFATLTLNNGADIVVVQNLLGHESPKTTQIYAVLSESRKKEQYNKYLIQ